MVLSFYPFFYAGGEGFYNSDMILMKKNAHEILTAGAPHTAE